LNDPELAGKLGVGRTTVTAIRRRFERSGMVSYHLLPDFARAGCELLTTLYGEFSGAAVRDLDVLRESLRDGVGSAFYMVRFGGQHLSFGAAESLTRVREGIIAHHRAHHESGYLTDRRHNYVFFPLKLTQLPRFFDYAPLVAERFGLKHSVAAEPKPAAGVWRPSRKELSTFNALVSLPGGSDEAIAKIAKVSRQTVNSLRNRFLGEGLLKPVRIPDVKRLGYGLLAFTHLHMSPHVGLDGRRKHTESVLADAAHVLKIAGDLETVLLSYHADYGAFRKSQERLLEVYKRDNMLSDEPVVKLFPLSETENILNHDYSNIVPGTV